jgi:hypothetical protein
MLPEILNRREFPGRRLPPNTVLVDRTTKWGNPFHIGADGTRQEVVAKHRAWLPQQPELMASIGELKRRNLMCWCAERYVRRGLCHACFLRELAN